MPSAQEIRHAESTDYAFVLGAIDTWFDGRPMARLLPRVFFVHFRQTCFVVESGGALVGCLVGFVSQTDPRRSYIHVVGVAPGVRTTGLGRRLYERFFEAATSLGCTSVHAVTSPENAVSIRFHEALGFAVDRGDVRPDGEGRIRFERRL